MVILINILFMKGFFSNDMGNQISSKYIDLKKSNVRILVNW